MATKKKSSKKKAVKKGATRKLSTADAKKLVKIDSLTGPSAPRSLAP